MPDHPRPRNKDFSRFDSMTDGELEAILRSDAQNIEGEESDTEMLLYVMEVLAERNKTTTSTNKSAKEAFETFKQYYMPETDDQSAHASELQKRKTVVSIIPLWLRRMSMVAAVVVVIMLGATTVSAFGGDFWEIVVQWTQETFHLGSANSTETMAPAVDDEREFESLQEVLDLEKITTPLVPTWIPDGYEFLEVRIEESPVQKKYVALYQCGDRQLKIQIKKYLVVDSQQMEQSEDYVEVYEVDGVEYYLIGNYDQMKAVWIIDGYECYISGPFNTEEMKLMIESIK